VVATDLDGVQSVDCGWFDRLARFVDGAPTNIPNSGAMAWTVPSAPGARGVRAIVPATPPATSTRDQSDRRFYIKGVLGRSVRRRLELALWPPRRIRRPAATIGLHPAVSMNVRLTGRHVTGREVARLVEDAPTGPPR